MCCSCKASSGDCVGNRNLVSSQITECHRRLKSENERIATARRLLVPQESLLGKECSHNITHNILKGFCVKSVGFSQLVECISIRVFSDARDHHADRLAHQNCLELLRLSDIDISRSQHCCKDNQSVSLWNKTMQSQRNPDAKLLAPYSALRDTDRQSVT